MMLDDIIMETEVRTELDKILVTTCLLGYEINEHFHEYSNTYYVELKSKNIIFKIHINVYNSETISLWIDSNKLFRCSYSDFDGNMVLPLKILNYVLANN